ncbi:MAG: hypothetical protein K2X08_00750, partial [Chlamydiales bacterium]|nr:hypothetical protein [Chlamydiales bacterium]
MSVRAIGQTRVSYTNNPAEREDVFQVITLQLRRKLCPLEHIPPFLEAYDRGLSLEEALEQFETLWKTRNKEVII